MSRAGVGRRREDLTFGEDMRGAVALFVDSKHLVEPGGYYLGRMDEAVARIVEEQTDCESVFFRLLENGRETGSHGWVGAKGAVEQWG